MTELEETAPAKETNQKLRDKFRLTKDEEILKEIKPSVFAFTSNYVLGVWIILIHMVFNGDFQRHKSPFVFDQQIAKHPTPHTHTRCF